MSQMVIDSFTHPSTTDVLRVVNRSLREGAVVLLCGSCEVEYDGRASGYLGPGERIVICKPDGTMLVHRPRGHDPVNWQPPGSTIQASEDDGYPVVAARRSNPDESVSVLLHDVYALVRFEADDTAPLRLEGTEADMHSYIEGHPEEIERDLRVIEHERDTPHGAIDFFAHDREGRPVVIEVKRRQATLTDVDQLQRYVSLYRESNPNTRGILAAPAASERVTRTLRDNDLEFVQVDAFSQEASDLSSTTFADFE